MAVVILAFGISAVLLARVNPIIFRARSRFQPGTKRWDKVLLSVILPAMVAIIPLCSVGCRSVSLVGRPALGHVSHCS
ncbi:hypothetical protein ACN2CC_32600 [Mesorhizobium muleiense]|uniref:hypothetical protein n=1 Tax=Mesorhizobium muleiense TaxID=1004279 RepID=UPI003AFA79FF